MTRLSQREKVAAGIRAANAEWYAARRLRAPVPVLKSEKPRECGFSRDGRTCELILGHTRPHQDEKGPL